MNTAKHISNSHAEQGALKRFISSELRARFRCQSARTATDLHFDELDASLCKITTKLNAGIEVLSLINTEAAKSRRAAEKVSEIGTQPYEKEWTRSIPSFGRLQRAIFWSKPLLDDGI